jgi:hypothetical protein
VKEPPSPEVNGPTIADGVKMQVATKRVFGHWSLFF